MNRVRFPSRFSRRVLAVAAATGAVAVAGVTAASVAMAAPSTSAGSFTFKLAPAAGITSCLPHAGGKVTITPDISSDKMTISVNGLPGVQYPGNYLPGHTTFDLALGKTFAEKYSVSVTALNVANRRVQLDNSLTFGGFHWNDPRQIYAEFRYRFHY